ncbi:hypothetical protein [Acetobacter estunensis]|nr:hypothetical protein [Acetobacter estunensis]
MRRTKTLGLMALTGTLGWLVPSHGQAQSAVNLERLHVPFDGPCENVARALKDYPPSTFEAALANQRWWNGLMAAGGIPPFHIQYDHYPIIDEFFEGCDAALHTKSSDIMHAIGLTHRWIVP